MDHVYRYLQKLHDEKISNDFDRLIIVLGEEGAGKSTFILSCLNLWYQILGREANANALMNHVVFDDRTAFKKKLHDSRPKDPLALMDAAHVLHKKETMHGDQIDVEKTLLDIRIENYVIFLGYQDWDDVPKQLQKRRSKNTFEIPSRGSVRGYNRASMDERYNEGSWPRQPDLQDTFVPLEGTELWETFNEIDRERKQDRLLEDDEGKEPKDIQWDVKAEVAIRAAKPWDENAGMKYDDIGDLINYSASWVSRRVTEWKKGEFAGAFNDIPDKPADAEEGVAEVVA